MENKKNTEINEPNKWSNLYSDSPDTFNGWMRRRPKKMSGSETLDTERCKIKIMLNCYGDHAYKRHHGVMVSKKFHSNQRHIFHKTGSYYVYYMYAFILFVHFYQSI